VLLENLAGLAAGELKQLERLLEPQKTLEDVVRFGLTAAPPKMIAAVITQDEFTHDVILPYEGGRFLVYDTT
jgi:hypothetical protein